MGKIKPLVEKSHEASQEAYGRIYKDVARFIRMKLKWRGIHSLITSELRSDIRGARLLDIGCGFGRFSFLAARTAKRVVGLDMTPQAIKVASVLRQALSAGNVQLVLSPIESYKTSEDGFDVVVLGGVLEHLIDPDAVFHSIGGLLRPGGILVVNAPSESNFRGDVSTTLLRLLGFPMSLSDVRIITLPTMEVLAQRHGYEISKVLGCMYRRAWTEMARKDLAERIPNVLEDVGSRLGSLDIDRAGFQRWVEERTHQNKEVLADWCVRGILKTIPPRGQFVYSEEVVLRNGLPLREIREYLAGDFSAEPYYCAVSPYNTLGGQTVYILRKNS